MKIIWWIYYQLLKHLIVYNEELNIEMTYNEMVSLYTLMDRIKNKIRRKKQC